MWYLYAPTKRATPSKAAPKASFGIFLGYRTKPGGEFSGQYLVADIEDFVNMNLDIDAVHTEYSI